MMISKNINFKDKIKYSVLFKITIFIILTWIHQPINDVCESGKYLEKKYKIDNTCNIRFSRLLAKDETQYELKNHGGREKLSYNKISMDSKKGKDDISTYRKLKRGYLNDLDAYKKGYKHRYSMKKGLGKLDCYFEKKVFDNVEHINELAEKWQGKKNAFIKKILKKITIPFILFSILPLIGITLNILFKADKEKNAIIPWCRYKACTPSTSCPGTGEQLYHFNRTLLESFLLLSNILWYTSIIIFIIFVIYIFIKVIKYERLKEGKTKMNMGEYCHLCKDVFT